MTGHILSAQANRQRIQRAAHDSLLSWCQLLDDGAIHRSPGLRMFHSHTGQFPSNLVITRLGRGYGEQLDAAIALGCAAGSGDLICWPSDPPRPRHLAAALLARGFEPNWQSNWMVLDFALAQPGTPPPPALQIIAATDESDIPDQHADDLPYYSRHEALQIVRAGQRTRGALRQLLGLFGGQLVAQASLHLIGRTRRLAIIRNVGVIPTMRRRGYGRALTEAALQIARDSGAALALLSATDEGQPLYEQIGFRPIGRSPTWVLRRTTMPQLPVPPAQRALAEAAGAGDIERLTALVDQGPDLIDAALPSQLTPLRIAAELRQLAAVEWLAARGATLDIVTAWRLGWRDRAAQILAERPELANLRSGPWQLTPLHVAVWEHDRALVELLLSASPDLSIRDAAFSSTPLGWAEHFQRHALASLIRAHQDRAGQV